MTWFSRSSSRSGTRSRALWGPAVAFGLLAFAVPGVGLFCAGPSVARALEQSTTAPAGGQDQETEVKSDAAAPKAGRPTSKRSRAAQRKRGRAASKRTTGRSTPEGGGTAADAPAAGAGQLQFSKDVAPILVANCVGCHKPGGVGVRRGKLDMTTFENLRKGTPDHPVVVAGKPDDSHLVLRIKGEETPKMPQGAQNSITDAAIATIDRWVKEGARLDAGIDPKAMLGSYASTPEQLRQRALAKLSPAERDEKVKSVGAERWKQANPKLKPAVVVGKQFIAFSNLPGDRAASVVKGLESQYAHLMRSFGLPARGLPEKVGLYVFNSRNDFVEFVRTVEGREIDAEVQASGKFQVPEPYIAVVDPLGGEKEAPAPRRRPRGRRGKAQAADDGPERTLLGLLTETLGVEIVGASGSPPPWLCEGIGGYLASRVEPRSPYYQHLRQTALANFQQGWETQAVEAMGGGERVSAADRRAIGFALVECMMTSPSFHRGFPAFVGGMLAGPAKLDDMLQDVYYGKRDQFLSITGEWVATRYGHNR